MLKKGLIQVYTGNTDQFNFAPIGLSLRAAGQNLRSLITCFLPHELMDGAAAASHLLKPNLIIDHSAVEKTGMQGKHAREKILASFERARQAAITADFDIIILNNIHPIVNQGIIHIKEILALMQEKSSNVELILTGPGAPEEVIETADLVTEMVVSHSKQEQPGPVTVVTGDGKGKTTYCLGKSMLASCLGIRSCVLQFIKSPQPYGEVKAIERFPQLSIKTMGGGFLFPNRPEENKKHLEAAQQAWEVSVKEILSQEYGLIVLDEINIATHYGLIQGEQIRRLLKRKPRNLHLLLTGRNAHPEVMEAATYVLEMKEIKHPFKKGIKARKGIEF